MTDEELNSLAERSRAGFADDADIATLIAELRRSRAELALLRPAGRAVIGFIKSNDRNDVDQQAYRLIAAGWTGGDE